MSGDMTIEERREAGFRAFRVKRTLSFPDGTRVARSSYLETDDEKLIGWLERSRHGTVVELELTDFPQVRVKQPVPLGAKTTSSAAPKDEAPGEPEPDWRYKTIPMLRTWLDSAVTPKGERINLPPANARKPTLESLASNAWSAGARPHALYGLPGGPQPTSGLPIKAATLGNLERALEAHDGPVPPEFEAALKKARDGAKAKAESKPAGEPEREPEPAGEELPEPGDQQPGEPEDTETEPATSATE